MQKNNQDGFFMPPDNGDCKWGNGAESYSREDVACLLWTQIAMLSNDIKTHCRGKLPEEIYDILDDPRIHEF